MLSSSLFVIVWAAVAFFVLRFVAAGYFHEKNRATVASAAVAVTFLVTSLSHSDLATVAAPAVATPPPAVAAAEAPSPTLHNVTALCQSVASKFAPGGVGSLDIARTDQGDIRDGDSLKSGRTLILAGWAIDKSKARVARSICMTIDGKAVAGASNAYGTDRADVSAALHNDAVEASGFAAELPLKNVTAGHHAFGIAVLSNDGTWALLSREFTFTLN